MISFILNDQDISTGQPPGSTVLDYVRYHKDLKGTKIGCREGDCGACTVLVGELIDNDVRYRSMTSCLMPLANAAGKHIVTVEGINPPDGSLTPVQRAMVDESGTQCGFCTVGFVMSLTGFCLERFIAPHTQAGSLRSDAVSSIDGNICRCTGYKSIERAAASLCGTKAEPPASAGGMDTIIESGAVPKYFSDVAERLKGLAKSVSNIGPVSGQPLARSVLPFVGGGTDLYVQRHDEMAEAVGSHLFYTNGFRSIRDTGEYIEIGASATVTDLLESSVMRSIFPDLYKHLKLVSSTPIRNMATLAGNFINASPIGDMTIWFLALDAEIVLSSARGVRTGNDSDRRRFLKDLFLGYKQLAKGDEEYIKTIRFRKPAGDFRFNFEKVCKRTYLDIATVNTAISLVVDADHIIDAHVAAGGVAPIPLYLKQTSSFLAGKKISEETIRTANEIMQSEVSPISDVRGTEQYKRLLLRQLFNAHFVEMFATENTEIPE